MEKRNSWHRRRKTNPFKIVAKRRVIIWLAKLLNLKERLRELMVYPIRLFAKAFIPKREDEVRSSKSPKANPRDWLFKGECLKAKMTKTDKERFGLIPCAARELMIVVWKRRERINNTVQIMKFRIGVSTIVFMRREH